MIAPMRSPHRSRFVNSLVCSLVLALGAACGAPPPPAGNGSTDGTTPANANSAGPSTPEQTGGDPAGASRKDLTVLAVGDVNLGRMLGKRILSGQKDLPFRNVRNEVSGADIAFANLESQISDQKGQTEGSSNYVFTGPPQGADELANAGFDVVATANNHAWDFGERALLETIANLKRVNIQYAGTGETLDAAYAPAIVERNGWRVGFLAVTGVFNSPFETSPARDHVAWADPVLVALKIKELRHQGVDIVLVSYHGGVEYSPDPDEPARSFTRACIDAGADAVIGHHPHIVQGVEWYNGKPIFYSLGNFVFKQFDPWTNLGLGIRLTFRDGKPMQVEYLPVAVDFQPKFLSPEKGAALIERVTQLSGGSLLTAPPSN